MSFSIFLKNFRSYTTAHFDFKRGVNFICAPNGWGKTNLLEAVSLLSPGRGLKKANAPEMVNTGANFFSISVKFNSIISSYEELKSVDDSNLLNINYFGDNKQFSWNGGKISGTELIEEIGVFWLTPQIIFNFWKEPKVRRDFFDRIVANFIPSHLYNCAKYEKIRFNRSKLIRSGCSNRLAYQAMEKILIEEGMMMIQNRQKIATMLNQQQEEIISSNDKEDLGNHISASRKSKHRIRCVGLTENTPQELLRENWRKDLEENRFGREKFGPQKTNIVIERVVIEESTLVTDAADQKNLFDDFTFGTRYLYSPFYFADIHSLVHQPFGRTFYSCFPVHLVDDNFAFLNYHFALKCYFADDDKQMTNKSAADNIISETNASKAPCDATEVLLSSELASTGQQHLMVINLVLTAFGNLKQNTKILLLDDILSHLDQKNRMLVMESINSNLLEDYVLITDTQIPTIEFEFNKIYLSKS